MDRVIALYPTPVFAERARTQLVSQGIATDRVDVVSRVDHGRVAHLPDQSDAEDMIDYFHVLLSDDRERSLVHEIVDAIHKGKGALVVHPRGQVEIDMFRPIIDANGPEAVFWRVAPEQAQGGLLGEHAAGFGR
jgi:hypothetical protein